MEPIIHSSLGTLTLSPSLPMTWKGEILSGSQPYSYDGALGTATLQKFRDEKFSICYAVSNFLQKIKLFWNEEPLLRLQYVMDGRLQYGGTDREWFKIKAGQMNAAWAPGRETAANFPKGRFEIFQIALGPEIVRELLPEFPSINSIPPETSRQWIGGDRQKDIYEILKASYSDNTRRFFYGIKVREHLLHYLRPMPDKNLNRYPEEIVERIHRVDREILKDLTQHHTNKDLANFARMPEGKLITLFKEIIGVSMFDRYKEAKLEKAKKYLLETNEQIKVLYETVGYESYTGFVEAFKERFGLSPLKFRKKFRPFD
jgi:AraC-like DNA-binding protein